MDLLRLPAEIRDQIYSILLSPDANRSALEDGYIYYNYRPGLAVTLVNRQIREESLCVFHKLNALVAIETPWREALPKVVEEGRVPIVVSGEQAETFDQWTMLVVICAPEFPFEADDSRRFIIHVDDLEAFCQTWMYSDLTHPGLNPHLELHLKIRRPRRGDTVVEDVAVPGRLQERLLLPFGAVKDLKIVKIAKNANTRSADFMSVHDELKRRMLTPHESPESCLRRATSLKDEGNEAFKADDYSSALEKYRLAWLAMHIVINGRTRNVHADAWFARELTEDPFKGFSGHSVRMALRIKLVANTVALYLKMEQWQDAIFWGTRTINMMRQAIGLGEGEEAASPEEEAIIDFVGATDMGKIYFRTAMAYKAEEDKYRARQLLKVAQVYLPNDRRVREEAIAVAPRLG